MKDDRLYLNHIIDCIAQIEAYTQNGQEAFMQNRLVQDAVIRNFEVMGEAAKRISPGLRTSHPEVPWQGITDFRNVLIHNYFKVDIQRVWQIVEVTLPTLKNQVETILQELNRI